MRPGRCGGPVLRVPSSGGTPYLRRTRRFLAVLAEDDHVEGGAREDLDGAQGVAEAVAVARRPRRWRRAGGPVRGGVDGCCAHVSMVRFPTVGGIGLRTELRGGPRTPVGRPAPLREEGPVP